MVLDGLDDLYEQRFGGAVGSGSFGRSEIWLVRLLTATGAALRGSRWEAQLAGVAHELQSLLGRGLDEETLGDAALAATADLRQSIAKVV